MLRRLRTCLVRKYLFPLFLSSTRSFELLNNDLASGKDGLASGKDGLATEKDIFLTRLNYAVNLLYSYVFTVLFAFHVVFVASAYPGYDDGVNGYGYDIKYPPHPYGFGYDIKDHHGNQQFRKEHSDGKRVVGSYGYTDAHGIHRLVDYVADEHGFRAKVRTNEPGTASQDPADVKMLSSAPLHLGNYLH